LPKFTLDTEKSGELRRFFVFELLLSVSMKEGTVEDAVSS